MFAAPHILWIYFRFTSLSAKRYLPRFLDTNVTAPAPKRYHQIEKQQLMYLELEDELNILKLLSFLII